MKPVSRNILIVTVAAVLGLVTLPAMARGGNWGGASQGNCGVGRTAALCDGSGTCGGNGAAASRGGRMGMGRNQTQTPRSVTRAYCDDNGPCNAAAIAPAFTGNGGTSAAGYGGRGRWN